MIRIKSVSIRESDVKYPGAKEHIRFVMEDGEGWNMARFRLHHFEKDNRVVFHRVSE